MTRWLVAAIIGVMVAALHYGLPWRTAGGSPALLRSLAFAARWLGAALIAALLLDAATGRERPRPPLVALDASLSWRRGGDAGSRYSDARARARELAGDSVLLVGDSSRIALPPQLPADAATTPGAAAERAREEGRPLHLLTDGEGALDMKLLDGGSRIEAFRRPPYADIALAELTIPERAIPGDTITARLTLRAGELPVPAASLTLRIDGGSPRTVGVAALPARGEREIDVTVVAPGGDGPRLVRAAVRTTDDGEPRNDSLATVIELSRAPAAVLVSTSPDPDAREVLASLRGALSAEPRGFYLVAPGQWRASESLAPVAAGVVRQAVADAPVVVLHGDSARTAPLRVLVRGSLIDVTPSGADARDEWRAAPGSESPLAQALGGVTWDSVPPIDLPRREARGDWIALTARAGNGSSRAVVAGSTRGARRTVHVSASGLWRWRARGGRARAAHDALWGAIIDWVAASRPDARAAVPSAGLVRAGERIAWRRGGADTVVSVALTDASGNSSLVELRFAAGASAATSAPLSAGEYLAVVPGGRALVVVNPSREWLPARQELRDTTIAGRVPSSPPRGVRSLWWAYGAALAAICAEWMLRRRAGLR